MDMKMSDIKVIDPNFIPCRTSCDIKLNTVYCWENVSFCKLLPDDSVDLTVTSPPYDDLRTYKGFTWRCRELAEELYRVTKPGGIVVWVAGDQTINGSETLSSFKQVITFVDVGWRLHDTMIYEKAGPAHPSANRYFQVFEYMFIFSKGAPKTFNPIKDRKNRWVGSKHFGRPTKRQRDGTLVEGQNPTVKEWGMRFNIWKFNGGYGYGHEDKRAHEHPATFPDALARDHIISWSNPGDLVFDPFSGSGTTLVQAKKLDRNFLGCDLSQEYCDLANRCLDFEPERVSI